MVKYNAAEVHITHSVVGLFLFLLIALSIWGIRRLHLLTGWAIYVSVGLLAAVTVYVGILRKKQKVQGISFQNTIWSMDFWFYLSCAALATHAILMVSLPVEWWIYTTPIAWVLLGEMYVLYVTAWDQGKKFRYYGWFCAITGIGVLLNYQTYYNTMQNFISFRFVSQSLAFKIGWIGLVILSAALWYFGKKKGTIWRFEGVTAIFALYWFVLQQGWLSGKAASLICGALILIHYICLRIMRHMKMIS